MLVVPETITYRPLDASRQYADNSRLVLDADSNVPPLCCVCGELHKPSDAQGRRECTKSLLRRPEHLESGLAMCQIAACLGLAEWQLAWTSARTLASLGDVILVEDPHDRRTTLVRAVWPHAR